VLRNAIITGRFKPGERLIERQLCEWTNVSRTSVREGLCRHLESEGLVDVDTKSRSGRHPGIGWSRPRNIYLVRAALGRYRRPAVRGQRERRPGRAGWGSWFTISAWSLPAA